MDVFGQGSLLEVERAGRIEDEDVYRAMYQARVTVAAGLSPGTTIANTARLELEEQNVRFHRTAVVRVGAPDLSPSTFRCAPSPALPGAVVSCTLALANGGPADALTATAAISLPADASFVPGSLAWEGGGVADPLTGTVRWTGPLSASSQVTVTYRLTMPTNLVRASLYNVAFLEDGTGAWWERPTWLVVEPLRCYLPLVARP